MSAVLKLAPAPAPWTGQPVIHTERLVLRPLRCSDMGLIEHYTADRRLAEGTRTIPNPLPPGATEAFVTRAMQATPGGEDTHVWAIDGTGASLAEVLGIVSLQSVADGQCELEFWIGHGLWNTGFATEAVEGLLSANPLNCRSFVAETFQDNPGSARVLTNCGFDYLGDAESWSVARGTRVPTWTYARSVG